MKRLSLSQKSISLILSVILLATTLIPLTASASFYDSNARVADSNYEQSGDITAPIVRSVTIDKTEINSLEDSINITADVIDDISGVRYVTLGFDKLYSYGLGFNPVTGKFEGKISVKDIPSLKSGNYNLTNIWVEDYIGNSREYILNPQVGGNGEPLPNKVQFTINYAHNVILPILTEIWADKTEVGAPDKFTVYARVDDKTKVKKIDLNFRTIDYKYFYSDLKYNSQLNMFTGEVVIPQYTPSSTLMLESAYLTGNDGSIVGYTNNISIGTDLLPLPQNIDVKINNPDQDVNAPNITKITINKTKFNCPDEIVAKIYAEDDKSGIKDVFLSFENVENGNLIQFNFIDFIYDFDEGCYIGSLNLTQHQICGNYKLFNANISDNAGNSKYYGPRLNPWSYDVSFLIESSQNNKYLGKIEDSDIIQKLYSSQEANPVIYCTPNSVISKELLIAIKETKKNVILEQEDLQWELDGSNLNGTFDDIYMTYSLVRGDHAFTDGTYPGDELGLKETDHILLFHFWANQHVPSGIKIKLNTTISLRKYINSNNMFLYAYNPQQGLRELQSGITISNDNYIEFNLTQAGNYVLSKDRIASASNNTSNSGGSGGGSTSSNKSIISKSQTATVNTVSLQSVKALLSKTKTPYVVMKNTDIIPANVIKYLQNTNKEVYADTVVNGKIISRIYLNPKEITKSVNTKITLNSTQTLQKLQGILKSKDISLVSLSHTTIFEKPIKLAVKLDLEKYDKTQLNFYYVDAKTKKLIKIEKPEYFIDINGFLHFQVDRGGDIVVTDKQL